MFGGGLLPADFNMDQAGGSPPLNDLFEIV
jgi:hypothetical protein